jgi:hypothetical protein
MLLLSPHRTSHLAWWPAVWPSHVARTQQEQQAVGGLLGGGPGAAAVSVRERDAQVHRLKRYNTQTVHARQQRAQQVFTGLQRTYSDGSLLSMRSLSYGMYIIKEEKKKEEAEAGVSGGGRKGFDLLRDQDVLSRWSTIGDFTAFEKATAGEFGAFDEAVARGQLVVRRGRHPQARVDSSKGAAPSCARRQQQSPPLEHLHLRKSSVTEQHARAVRTLPSPFRQDQSIFTRNREQLRRLFSRLS